MVFLFQLYRREQSEKGYTLRACFTKSIMADQSKGEMNHDTHLLLWGLGLVLYGIASFCAAYYMALGWHPLIFRLWYLCGAMLSAAWLGQGTIYLLARRSRANALMVVLVIGSLYALIRIIGAQLDPSMMSVGPASWPNEMAPSGYAITTGGVRILTPFFNAYGVVALVGGAAYSVWIFWRKRILLHQAIGNILIAVGAMAPALEGLFSPLGLACSPTGELIGAILMFIGFTRATSPVKK